MKFRPTTATYLALVLISVLTLNAVFSYKSAAPSARPNIVMETLDPSLEQYEGMWAREISRRFDNAVGVLVHGGDFVEGQWIVGSHAQPWRHVTPIQEVVKNIQKKYPGRTVVVLACNTGHLKLGIPGVFYAHSSVWCVVRS